MLYISDIKEEQCDRDKKPIHIICPHIWIHYVMDGQGYFNETPLKKGDAFIVYKGDECTYRPHPDDPWKYLWTRLLGDDSDDILKKYGFPRTTGIFSFSYFDDLRSLAYSIDQSQALQNGNRTFAEAGARLILSLNCRPDRDKSASAGELWVDMVKKYVDANLHKPIRIEALANHLHIDRKYLRNLFVHYEGISPQKYILNARIRHAKELLRTTDSSVSMIAASVGYEDALGFSKIFKKHTGVSPTEYRSHPTL